MFRWLGMCVVLCVGTYAAVALVRPLTTTGSSPVPRGEGAEGVVVPIENAKAPKVRPQADTRENIQRNPTFPGRANVNGLLDASLLEPYTIYRAQVHVYDTVEVPSEREGKLNFVATEFKGPLPSEWVLKDLERRGKAYRQEVRYLAIEADPAEVIAPSDAVTTGFLTPNTDPTKRYRRWKEGDLLEPGRLKVAQEFRWLRRLDVGEFVQGPKDGHSGDLLALVNPELAFCDLQIKAAKVEQAAADWRASVETKNELERQWTRDEKLYNQGGRGAIPYDEVMKSKLGFLRYKEEAISKFAGIASAQQELLQAITVTKLHQVRAMQSGTIQQIHKHTGDAVKQLEPVMEIANTDRPRFEGKIELQYSYALRARWRNCKHKRKARPSR